MSFLRSFQQSAMPTQTPTNDYSTKTRLAPTFLIFGKNLNESWLLLSIRMYLHAKYY